MKKWMLIVFVASLLCGCGAQTTFETVDDTDIVSAAAQNRRIQLDLPPEAATPTMETVEGAALYQCDGYELTLQTLPGGDLNRTLRQVTGHDQSSLRPIKTKAGVAVRYDMAWAAAGETGDRVARCVLLDDGQNHYTVTVMADAARAGDLTETWKKLLGSITLHTG